MEAQTLYNRLENDFVTSGFDENWYDDTENMSVFDEYICDNFKQRSMGLLCDFTVEINRVYTAVFPSDKALSKILDDNIRDAMLFVHHPLIWDLSKNPQKAFYPIDTELLSSIKENRISIFNFHLPLDNYCVYSTTKTLADALGIKIEKPYSNIGGAVCGIIGTTGCGSIYELNSKLAQVVGHKTKLYQYGEVEIRNRKVSLCAGGGNDLGVVKEMIEEGVNVHITGLSSENSYSTESHRLENEHKISLLGGTHYSTEKFACMAMCKYFNKLGIDSEFINDFPCFEDL